MFGLGHIDMMPLFYGAIMFLGVMSMWKKLMNLELLAFSVEAGVFWLVFTMHGGTMSGGFAAMVCALLAGIFIPRTLR